jgi:hypothetical protein
MGRGSTIGSITLRARANRHQGEFPDELVMMLSGSQKQRDRQPEQSDCPQVRLVRLMCVSAEDWTTGG